MNRPATLRSGLVLALLVSAAGCGRALTVPEKLEIHDYPANTALTLTFVMKSCSDTCETYESPSCSLALQQSVGVSPDGISFSQTLVGSVAVGFGDKAGADPTTLKNCSLQCGPAVLAHCSVPALSPGTYGVEIGTFKDSIVVH
ncbi:MAG: hypothetical protein U1E65_03760 [Myxococcota bacterium]